MKKSYGDHPGGGQSRSRVLPGFIHNPALEARGADLNDILGNVLQDLPDNSASVIRCDELPVVRGDRDKFANCFRRILNFIVSYPPDRTTLFLYIKCEIARTEYIDMSIGADQKMYKISFHTNSEAEGEGFPEIEKNFCTNCLTEIKGNFNINSEPGTGWLFNLEVPGKLK